jgi:hypothetical protein
MTEQELEQEIQAKGLTAARLTPDLIDSKIVHAQYHVFEGSTTTVCCLTLINGATVIGSSACVSKANFDAEVGRKVAYENARNEIWALEGYLLRQHLSDAKSV